MAKKTQLNENATIYQQREKISERDKLKSMSFKQKIEYLWEYYKLHFLGIVAAIAFLVYVIVQIVTPNMVTLLHVALIDNTIPSSVIEEMKEDMAKEFEISTPYEEVNINPMFTFAGDSQYSRNMREVFVTRVIAKEIDVVIAPLSEFQGYAYKGFMYRLSDVLPTDLYSSLTDHFYVFHQEDDPTESVYGLYVEPTSIYGQHHISNPEDPYVLGIIGNTPNQDNSIDFIRYLFQQ